MPFFILFFMVRFHRILARYSTNQMSEPDLAFIRAEIDYDKGRPLDRKTIIPLFNEYILRICDIQNAFATRLESSFQALDTKLDRAETLLCLIEKRVCFFRLYSFLKFSWNVSALIMRQWLKMKSPSISHKF
jgi:hypothetical protein